MDLRTEIRALQQTVVELNQKVDSLSGPIGSGTVSGNPGAPQTITLREDTVLGNPEAAIAIVEFSDFECPFCARHHRTVLPQIKQSYVDTGQVQYIVRDYPLPFHAGARSAAIAANCAGEQGQYWPMHDLLFENNSLLGESLYRQSARSLGLDEAAFARCLQNPDNGTFLDQEMAYGDTVGVLGTPKFFVGKVQGDVISDVIPISGAQPFSAFVNAISRLSQ